MGPEAGAGSDATTNAIVFGVSGQDGYYVEDLLAERSIRTIGVARSPGSWTVGDVSDREFVSALVARHRPGYILHLAATSSTAHDALFENHETIATGSINILEAARRHAPEARVFIVGSGLQFADLSAPIKESDEFAAHSSYAAARIYSTYAARYFRGLGMRVYVGYLFHHESPRRRDRHVSQRVVRGLQAIAAGRATSLHVADPSVRREWVHARDVMRAALTLMDQEAVFEATIGSGEAASIDEWITACAERLDLDRRNFDVASDADFVPEYRVLVSNPATIHSLGWRPQVSFGELASRMVGA